jgi:flagellar hook assembly protein FlgD
VPASTGQNRALWDGRGNDGAILQTGYKLLLVDPTRLEIHPIIVRHEREFANVRANPYLFYPAHAQVTNLRYTPFSSAHVAIDVIDPNGSFLTTLQPSTAQAAGDYEVRWDGREPDGEIVTMLGSYTLRLTGVDDLTGASFSRNATVMVSD